MSFFFCTCKQVADFYLFYFFIDPALSVTHPSLSTPPPSGTSETPGRRQPLQWPITPLIAYQIQFGIAVNEAKCSLLCVRVSNCVRLDAVCCPCHPQSVELKHLIAELPLVCLPKYSFVCLIRHSHTHTHTHSWILRGTRILCECMCTYYTFKHFTAYCWLTF